MDEQNPKSPEEALEEALYEQELGGEVPTESQTTAPQEIVEESVQNPFQSEHISERMQEILKKHPMMLEAQRIIQERSMEQAKQFAMKSLQELRKMYPQCSIQSLADLAATPEGKTALEYWKRGVPLAQAYSAAFANTIAQNGAQAAKQQAMNDMNSKVHIAQPSGGSGGGRVMSAEDRAIWKEFFPDATDAQLQEKWSKVK